MEYHQEDIEIAEERQIRRDASEDNTSEEEEETDKEKEAIRVKVIKMVSKKVRDISSSDDEEKEKDRAKT